MFKWWAVLHSAAVFADLRRTCKSVASYWLLILCLFWCHGGSCVEEAFCHVLGPKLLFVPLATMVNASDSSVKGSREYSKQFPLFAQGAKVFV